MFLSFLKFSSCFISNIFGNTIFSFFFLEFFYWIILSIFVFKITNNFSPLIIGFYFRHYLKSDLYIASTIEHCRYLHIPAGNLPKVLFMYCMYCTVNIYVRQQEKNIIFILKQKQKKFADIIKKNRGFWIYLEIKFFGGKFLKFLSFMQNLL